MSQITASPGAPGNYANIGAGIIHASALHKPEYDPQYYERFKGQFEFIKLLEALGRKKRISNNYIEHFEIPRTMKAFQVGTITAGSGAGATKSAVPIHANSHTDGQSFPMVGDIILYPNKVRAKIIAKDQTANANTIDVAPLLATDTIPAVTALDYLFVFSNMHPTGSSAPESRNWAPFEARSYLQIIRAKHSISNSATFSQSWVDIAFKEGDAMVRGGKIKPGNYKYLADEKHTYELFRIAQELALVYNVTATNTTITSPGSNEEQYSTHGLIPSIEDHGINPAAYTTGAFSLTNFEAISTSLLANSAGAQEYLCMFGIALRQECNSFLHTLYNGGAVVYNTFGDNKDRAVKYGFDSFNVDGRTYHLKTYGAFSDPETFGAPGFDYAGDGFMMPMGSSMDAKSGNRIDNISLLYRGNGEIDRDIITQFGGGMRNDQINATSSIDRLEVDYLSECGIQTVGLNSFVAIQRA